jgi:hypothetical protein
MSAFSSTLSVYLMTTKSLDEFSKEAGFLGTHPGLRASTAAKSTMSLFRAVWPAEPAQIVRTGTFMNIAIARQL